MNTITREASDHGAIHTLLASWAQAVTDKEVGLIGSHYTTDVLAFDAIGPLQFNGREAYLRHWQACMTMCAGPTVFEVEQLHAELGCDLGFAHLLCRCGGTDEQGQAHVSWMRVTHGYRKQNGHWLIAHEHFSLPFDPATGKTIFDLQP